MLCKLCSLMHLKDREICFPHPFHQNKNKANLTRCNFFFFYSLIPSTLVSMKNFLKIVWLGVGWWGNNP